MADRRQAAAADHEEDEAQEQAQDEAHGEAGEADPGHDRDQDRPVGTIQPLPLQNDPFAHELEPDEHDQATDHEGRDPGEQLRAGEPEAERRPGRT